MTDPIQRRDFLRASACAGAALAAAAAGTIAARPIPATGEALPVLGFGTYRTYDLPDKPMVQANLQAVTKILFDAGGTVLDSSPMYGSAEARAGEALAALNLTGRAFVMTKVWTSGEAAGIRQMRNSLRHFKRDKIELMQVHNLVDWRTQLKTLRAWKERGTFRYIGLTHFTTSAFDDLMAVARVEKIDFLQFPYSIARRDAESRLLPFCRDKGIATVANVPFGGGGLFRRVRGKPVPAWAADFGADSWARFFLKYVLGDPALTCAIPGTGKVRHARDNIGGGIGRMPTAAERRRMIRVMAGL
jgi:diketogulonate reductase-like aldo/keto reductase